MKPKYDLLPCTCGHDMNDCCGMKAVESGFVIFCPKCSKVGEIGKDERAAYTGWNRRIKREKAERVLEINHCKE